MDDLDFDQPEGPSIDDLQDQWEESNPPEVPKEAPTAEEWNASQRGGDIHPEQSQPKEPQSQQQSQQQQAPDYTDYVPRQALNGVLGELTRVRAEAQYLKQQQEAYLRAIAEKTGAVEAPPDPADIDPVTAITSQLAEIRTTLAQREWHEQQQQVAARVRHTLDADLTQTRQQLPDFDDAFNHVRAKLVESLRVQGVTDPQAIQQAVVNWDARFVQNAVDNGHSPAQALYAFAWQNGFGGRQQQAQAPPSRMDTIQQRYEAAAGVPGGGRAGNAPNGVPRNQRQLASLSDDQHAQLLDGMGDAQADQYLYDLMGGSE